MTPKDYLTDEQREQDYPMIRQAAAEWLVPKPWKHKPEAIAPGDFWIGERCKKCHVERTTDTHTVAECDALWSENTCTVPDPDSREMPLIVDDLIREVMEVKGSFDMWQLLCDGIERFEDPIDGNHFAWWLMAGPATRAAIALAALKTTNTGGTT